MSVYISSYCRLTKDSCILNGELLKTFEDGLGSWAKQLYKYLGLDYPKLHKMDELAKYAFLASEIATADLGIEKHYQDDEVGLLFANSSSSHIADTKFQKSYAIDGSPSPGVFVYTLPNILMGEISIRKKWFGDNRFVIQKEFDPSALITQIELMHSSGSDAVLAGWVEVNQEEIDVLVFIVEKTDRTTTSLELNKEVLSNLHQN